MAHTDHIREKAVALRTQRRLTIDEIAERLALPRTTIYGWVGHIEIERTPRQAAAQRRAAEGTARRAREAREAAYEQGRGEYAGLVSRPGFRDFLCLYVAEGYKRSRNTASIGNSDAAVMRVAVRWMRTLTDRPIRFAVQHHLDQEPDALRAYWSRELGIEDPSSIRLVCKSNSGQLRTRTWRCVHGVASATVHDTRFRSRLQAWLDCIRAEWT